MIKSSFYFHRSNENILINKKVEYSETNNALKTLVSIKKIEFSYAFFFFNRQFKRFSLLNQAAFRSKSGLGRDLKLFNRLVFTVLIKTKGQKSNKRILQQNFYYQEKPNHSDLKNIISYENYFITHGSKNIHMLYCKNFSVLPQIQFCSNTFLSLIDFNNY
ncbi:hypothetical protein BpHYR1_012183 [Brachionus plicatilis]|uniref:Uncharacterized protein n=1 Tax=Brachionus plicatilis TaxID=10195 RepID=A0A3M7Q5X2_BRAPC|nr:hypothetical protein BpHYR1_012183 [Brachionus plicatilis]